MILSTYLLFELLYDNLCNMIFFLTKPNNKIQKEIENKSFQFMHY